MHRSSGSHDDSFTSITSVSTNSSLEDFEEDVAREHKKHNMGQKNTRARTASKSSDNNSTSAKHKDSVGGGREGKRGSDNERNADGEFVEVLDSDEDSKKRTKGDKQEGTIMKDVRYKLGPLLGDSSSEENAPKGENSAVQETSSEDDYDQPEEIDGITESSRKKRALQNWRRVFSKLKTQLLLVKGSNIDDGSGKYPPEENAVLQEESESESSIQDEIGGKAVANWTRLVSKLTGREAKDEISFSDALLANIAAAGETSSSEDEPEPEQNERAIENWRKILSKVIDSETSTSGFNLKDMAEQIRSRNDIALRNWERLVSKLTQNNRKENIAKMIHSGLVENRDSDTEDDETGVKTAVLNWERLLLKVIQKSRNDDIKSLLQASMESRVPKGDNETHSSKENKDLEEPGTPIKHWEMMVSKLMEKNRNIDLGRLVQAKREKDDKSLNTKSDTNSASSTKEKIDSERSIRNWEIIVSKLMKKIRGNFTKELLKSKLIDDEHSSQDSDTSSGRESSRVLKNWEKLVLEILKKSRIMDLQASIMGNEERERESRSSNEESDNTKSTGKKESIKSLKAKKNWRSITKKLMAKTQEFQIRHAIQEQLGKTEEHQEDKKYRDARKRDSLRGVKNWERIVAKLIKSQRMTAALILEATTSNKNSAKDDDDNDSLSSSSDDLETLRSKTTNKKKLRAMKNWRRMSSNLKAINEGKSNDDGTDVKEMCPSCKNECQFPILLSCAHTFCRDCITKLIEDSEEGASFACPTCEAKIKLSDNDEELFCPNFIVLQQIQHIKSGNDGCKYCGKAEKAKFVCEQCADKYCKNCATKHTKREVFESHNLLDLESTENVDKLRKKYYCLKHTKEELTHYCLTCDTSVCTKCAKKKHKGSKHDCGLVSEAAEAGREVLEDAAQTLEGVTDFNSDLVNIDKMQNGLDIELDEMREEIKSRVQYLIKRLREREARLYEEVEGRYNVIYDALSRRKDDIKLAARQTENFQTVIHDLHKHENDVEMLQMQATVSERMKDIIELKIEEGMFIDYDFIFNPGQSGIESLIDNYGYIKVEDRESKRTIVLEGYEDREEIKEVKRIEENLIKTEHDENMDDRFKDEDYGYDQPLDTWSPTVRKRNEKKERKREKPKEKYASDSEDEEESKKEHKVPRDRKRKPKGEEKKTKEMLPHSPKKQVPKTDTKSKYEELKPQTYEFEGLRQPPYEGFTQLTSDRGEQVKVLKYAVRNYKNESCDVQIKMTCPDKSIVSAHVAENADGAFTIFFCPDVKKDFNCFMTIAGKSFKKEYNLLNFYGDFQGMKSKEIDLACRAVSLLRWHITPGLLENKNGKIKRSRKFMKIIGTHK